MSLADRPLTSLQSVILVTGPFVFLWTTIKNYVARHGPFAFGRQLTTLNSQIYALFSLGLAYLILNDVFQLQQYESIKSADLAYVYHLSTFYEYIDVFLLVATGHTIGPHMAFHHLTMPFLTHFRVLNASDWQLFAFLNCVHHFWMYSYFGGAAAFRPILPVTGWVQLCAGIGLDVYYLYQHGNQAAESASRAISVLLLTRYAMLFYDELKGGSQQKSTAPADKDE